MLLQRDHLLLLRGRKDAVELLAGRCANSFKLAEKRAFLRGELRNLLGGLTALNCLLYRFTLRSELGHERFRRRVLVGHNRLMLGRLRGRHIERSLKKMFTTTAGAGPLGQQGHGGKSGCQGKRENCPGKRLHEISPAISNARVRQMVSLFW